MNKLANKMRQERLRRNMTLKQLSERTGLSNSFLSQIERGLAQPSITSLKKIALQLGISVVRLYADKDNDYGLWEYKSENRGTDPSNAGYIQDVKIVRADRRKGLTLPGSNVVYELLTPDLNRKLEIMYLRITKGENSGDEPVVDPLGEKFGLVLKGGLDVRVGQETYRLNTGDSIYFPADLPHSWEGVDGDAIEVIWVVTPPCF